MTEPTKLPEAQTESAKADSVQRAGSAASSDNTGLPMNVLRLVCQIEDTEVNRVLFEQIFRYIQKQPFPGSPSRHAILKLEQVYITAAKRMLPNGESSHRPSNKEKS